MEEKEVVTPVLQVSEKTSLAIELHKEIINDLLSAFEKAVRLGGILTEIKNELPYGSFGKFIETNMPFSRMTANRYIRVYQSQDKLRLELKGNLELKKAYKFLESPKEKHINPEPEPDTTKEVKPITEPLNDSANIDISDQGKTERTRKVRSEVERFNARIKYYIGQLKAGKSPSITDKKPVADKLEKQLEAAKKRYEELLQAKENLDRL